MRAAALAFAALTACAAVQSVTGGGQLHLPAVSHYDVWLDPSLSAQSRAAVVAAVTQWATYTDVVFAVHEGVRICIDDCFSFHEVPRAQLDGLTEGDYVGYTIPGFVFLAAGMPDAEVRQTAIHELGHALGLMHRPAGTNAVMVGNYYGAAKHVCCDDVASFFAARNAPVPSGLTACTDAAGELP